MAACSNEFLDFAVDMTKRMGALARSRFGNIVARRKPDATLVTEADLAAEALARHAIAAAYPDHGILGEEEGLSRPDADHVWVIDPIDGTTNFSRGVPLYAVSVALFHHKRPIVGVTFAPELDDLCAAVAGGGARINGEPFTCPQLTLQSESPLALGSIHRRDIPPPHLWRVLRNTRMRNTGSAVINLVYVALGRFDACVAEHLSLWDVAAAALICTEAGALVSLPNGEPLFPLAHAYPWYAANKFPLLAAGPGVYDVVRGDLLRDFPME